MHVFQRRHQVDLCCGAGRVPLGPEAGELTAGGQPARPQNMRLWLLQGAAYCRPGSNFLWSSSVAMPQVRHVACNITHGRVKAHLSGAQ